MRDEVSGIQVDNQLFTIDVDVPEVEQQLRTGGFGESGFEVIDFIGFEVLQEPQEQNQTGD